MPKRPNKRPSKRALPRAVVAVALAALAGCDSPSGPAAQPSASTSVAAPAAPDATATTAGEAAANPHAGAYAGSYKANAGEVTVPAGTPYRPWDGADGETATGDGTLTLRVADDGAVSGELTGVLGELKIRGALDGADLRAGLTASDPTAEAAMTGVMTGATRQDGKLTGEIRVSSGDGITVRQARFEAEKRDP